MRQETYAASIAILVIIAVAVLVVAVVIYANNQAEKYEMPVDVHGCREIDTNDMRFGAQDAVYLHCQTDAGDVYFQCDSSGCDKAE